MSILGDDGGELSHYNERAKTCAMVHNYSVTCYVKTGATSLIAGADETSDELIVDCAKRL